jgi:cytochrome bd-type quinol oxidase subunit 2
MSASAPEATNDYSTRNRPSRPSLSGAPRARLGLCALALLGALLLVISTFLTLYEIGNGQATLRSVSAYSHHSVAMLLLGLAAVPMALGALRGARPAMIALGVIGVIVLVVAVTVDLPAAIDEGVLSVTYEGASASPAIGFFVETLGGVLLLASGGLQLMRGD